MTSGAGKPEAPWQGVGIVSGAPYAAPVALTGDPGTPHRGKKAGTEEKMRDSESIIVVVNHTVYILYN